MDVPKCALCTPKEPYLNGGTIKLPVIRKDDDFLILQCEKCGRVYCYSFLQYLTMFLVKAILIAVFIVIPKANAAGWISKFLILLIAYYLSFIIPHNTMRWKLLNRGYPTRKEYRLIELKFSVTSISACIAGWIAAIAVSV